jgi:hypothetical protein
MGPPPCLVEHSRVSLTPPFILDTIGWDLKWVLGTLVVLTRCTPICGPLSYWRCVSSLHDLDIPSIMIINHKHAQIQHHLWKWSVIKSNTMFSIHFISNMQGMDDQNV